MATPTVEIDAILFEREPGCWVGQCLQYDIGAQADSLPELAYQLQRSLVGYAAICAANNVEAFSDLESAPRVYWDMWRKATMRVVQDEAHFRAPKPTVLPRTSMKVAEREQRAA